MEVLATVLDADSGKVWYSKIHKMVLGKRLYLAPNDNIDNYEQIGE